MANKCQLETKKDLSPYYIKTTDGGNYIAIIEIERTQADKDYVPTLQLPSLRACGNMTRWSDKYPVYSWSIDSRYSSREGGWKNNLTSDYETLYEFMTDAIADDRVNADKFKRLRERQFISENNQVNLMVVKGKAETFFAKIPQLDEKCKRQFADYAFEYAQTIAHDYPSQMQDLIFSWTASGFISNEVALMVMDILYGNGTLKALTDREKITSNLIVFTDVLPLDAKSKCLKIRKRIDKTERFGLKNAKSPFPKKVTLRLCCSLLNALRVLRLATNFFRGRVGSKASAKIVNNIFFIALLQ